MIIVVVNMCVKRLVPGDGVLCSLFAVCLSMTEKVENRKKKLNLF